MVAIASVFACGAPDPAYYFTCTQPRTTRSSCCQIQIPGHSNKQKEAPFCQAPFFEPSSSKSLHFWFFDGHLLVAPSRPMLSPPTRTQRFLVLATLNNSEIGARSLTSPPNHWLRIHISSLGWAGGRKLFLFVDGSPSGEEGHW